MPAEDRVRYEDLAAAAARSSVSVDVEIMGVPGRMRALGQAEMVAITLAWPAPPRERRPHKDPTINEREEAQLGAAWSAWCSQQRLLEVALAIGYQPSPVTGTAGEPMPGPAWQGTYLRAGQNPAADSPSASAALGARRRWCVAVLDELGAMLSEEQVDAMHKLLTEAQKRIAGVGLGNSGAAAESSDPSSES